MHNPTQTKLEASTQTWFLVLQAKRKRADEKDDDDVQVVHEVPVDIQDGGADADIDDEDGAVATGERITMPKRGGELGFSKNQH
jgi:hypothetical protein